MNILITGSNGFLGRNIIKYFDTHTLYGLDVSSGTIQGVPIFSSKDLELMDIPVDCIIMCHAAVASGNSTVSNDVLYEVNVKLTQQIINKYQNVPIVYISTASVYTTNTTIFEDTTLHPQNPYAISKLWAENIVLQTNRASVIRLSSLYGIGMKENTLIPNYVNQAIQNKEIEVWGDGSRKQNYVFVEDIAIAIQKMVAKKEVVYQKVFLGVAPKEYTNLEVAKIIADRCKASIKNKNQDHSKSIAYNNEYSKKVLDWNIENSLESKLNEYIEWKLKK